MFAQSPFVSQFISSCSKLSFKNCLQQQQSLLVSLRHSSSPTSISWAARCLLERKINSGKLFFFLHTPMRMLVRLCDTWGLFNKTSSSNITLKPDGGCTSVHIQVQYYPTASQIPVSGGGRVRLLLPGSCWSLRCFPSAILASLRWNLEQSSSLAEMKIKRAELQQKICARWLKRHQSAKPHLGWTHSWLFIVLKEKAKTTREKRRPFGFRICSYLSGWL